MESSVWAMSSIISLSHVAVLYKGGLGPTILFRQRGPGCVARCKRLRRWRRNIFRLWALGCSLRLPLLSFLFFCHRRPMLTLSF